MKKRNLTKGNVTAVMLLFAVPSIEALLAGMRDDWHFEVIYQGTSIADIASFEARRRWRSATDKESD